MAGLVNGGRALIFQLFDDPVRELICHRFPFAFSPNSTSQRNASDRVSASNELSLRQFEVQLIEFPSLLQVVTIGCRLKA
jgi:hypothetical protein